MALIPAARFEELAKALGNDFGFNDLGLVLHRCFGDARINEFSAEIRTRWEIGADCLRGTEKYGMTRNFLALVLASPRAGDPLRQLIVQLLPELAAAQPDTRAHVQIVVDQLNQTRADLGQATIRAAISAPSAAFADIAVNVTALEIYKNLHDSLHNLQIRNFADLRSAVQSMGRDLDDDSKLREFHDQVRTSCAQARPFAQRLGASDVLRAAAAVETNWIDKMENAANELATAIDAADAAKGRLALNVIWRIVEREPSRLNGQIFLTARDLQLLQLEGALKAVAEQQPGNSAIARACDSLRDLKVSLLGHVVDHSRWQDVDDGLWIIDRAFEFRSDSGIDDFVLDWPTTRSLVRTLAQAEPGAKWAENVLRYADRVDEELIRLEAQAGKAEAAPAAAVPPLYRLYDAFRREARFRFYRVDQALKGECAVLVGIGAPLQSLLTELHHA